MSAMIVKRIIILFIAVLLVGCKEEIEIDLDVIGFQMYGSYLDGDTSYFWVTLKPKKSITLNDAKLNSEFEEVKAQVIEYEPSYTVESFENSEEFEMPHVINKDESIRILFKSDKMFVDVTTVQKIHLEVDGKNVEIEVDYSSDS